MVESDSHRHRRLLHANRPSRSAALARSATTIAPSERARKGFFAAQLQGPFRLPDRAAKKVEKKRRERVDGQPMPDYFGDRLERNAATDVEVVCSHDPKFF
jgi:hypothetical protein